jgi:phosphomevalonate kinase
MQASAPGKLILSGEYAVLDGAPALVIAVDRRATARRTHIAVHDASPFLRAVARHAGTPDLGILADSSSFYDGPRKLGLGSSAAVTVAATACALAPPRIDEAVRAEILAVAMAAHAEAQGSGSGADVAASVYGGAIAFVRGTPPQIAARTWPAGLRLVPFWTGTSADTATLVEQVSQARRSRPAEVGAALDDIAAASRELCAAITLDGFAHAAAAMEHLARATELSLVPQCVHRAAAALAGRAVVKTTGAGGGDIGFAVAPEEADVTYVEGRLIEAGCSPLRLALDTTGVDVRPDVR